MGEGVSSSTTGGKFTAESQLGEDDNVVNADFQKDEGIDGGEGKTTQGHGAVKFENAENEADKGDKDTEWKETAAKVASAAKVVGFGVAIVSLTGLAIGASVVTGGAALPVVVGVGYGLYVGGNLALTGGIVAEEVLGPDQTKKTEAAQNFVTRFTEKDLNTYHKILNPPKSSFLGVKGQGKTTLEDVLQKVENKKPCDELKKLDDNHNTINDAKDLGKKQKKYLNNNPPKSWDIDAIKNEKDLKKRLEMIEELDVDNVDDKKSLKDEHGIPKEYHKIHAEMWKNLLILQVKALQSGASYFFKDNQPSQT